MREGRIDIQFHSGRSTSTDNLVSVCHRFARGVSVLACPPEGRPEGRRKGTHEGGHDVPRDREDGRTVMVSVSRAVRGRDSRRFKAGAERGLEARSESMGQARSEAGAMSRAEARGMSRRKAGQEGSHESR